MVCCPVKVGIDHCIDRCQHDCWRTIPPARLQTPCIVLQQPYRRSIHTFTALALYLSTAAYLNGVKRHVFYSGIIAVKMLSSHSYACQPETQAPYLQIEHWKLPEYSLSLMFTDERRTSPSTPKLIHAQQRLIRPTPSQTNRARTPAMHIQR